MWLLPARLRDRFVDSFSFVIRTKIILTSFLIPIGTDDGHGSDNDQTYNDPFHIVFHPGYPAKVKSEHRKRSDPKYGAYHGIKQEGFEFHFYYSGKDRSKGPDDGKKST